MVHDPNTYLGISKNWYAIWRAIKPPNANGTLIYTNKDATDGNPPPEQPFKSGEFVTIQGNGSLTRKNFIFGGWTEGNGKTIRSTHT